MKRFTIIMASIGLSAALAFSACDDDGAEPEGDTADAVDDAGTETSRPDTTIAPVCTEDQDCEGKVIPRACERVRCLTDLAICGVVPVDDGAACDAGNQCTTNDVCEDGACVGGDPIACDDGNPCTDDTCDPERGCVHGANSAPCDDGNACTSGDRCFGGTCQGEAQTCDDGNPCTDDTCDPELGCVHVDNEAPCIDNDICTEDETCVEGECVGERIPGCSSNICGDGICDGNEDCNSCPDDCPTCCPAGDVANCQGGCTSAGWIGDGWCDSVLECEETEWDGGDCEPCFPDCAPGTCGDDGCGGRCNCEVGLVCTDDEACEADLPGSGCEDPLELDLVDGSASGAGDLSDPDIAYDSFNRSQCDSSSTAGLGFRDQAWRFLAAEAGTYRVTATPDVNAHDLMIYIYPDSVCDGTCIFEDSGSTGPVSRTVQIEADDSEVYFAVDAYNAEAQGTYAVDVCDATCRIDEGCGFNGCGEPCGCVAGETCDAGTCIPTPGDSCETALTLTDHGDGTYSGEGDLSAGNGLSSQYDSGTCPGTGTTGTAQNDEVWAFVAPEAGTYEAVLYPGAGEFSFQLYAFAGEDCDGDCIARSNDNLGDESAERLTLTAEAADDVFFLVVDGTTTNHAAYTITVGPPCVPDCETEGECGVTDGCFGACTCEDGDLCDTTGELNACLDAASVPGNTCEAPFVVEIPEPFDDPITLAGDTRNASNTIDISDSDWCDGLSFESVERPEQVWSFTAPIAAEYTFEVTPDVDLMLYVLGDCADAETTCLGGSDSFGTSTETVAVSMEADETVYLVVDAWSSGSTPAGAYTLTVVPPCELVAEGDSCEHCPCEGGLICSSATDTCVVPAAGDTCDDPYVVEAPEPFDEPIVLEGSTVDATNGAIVDEDSCAGLTWSAGEDTSDQIFAFTAETAGTYTASVDSSSDLMIYAITECGAPDDSCLGGQDTGNPETVDVTLAAGETAYIVVDTFSASTEGDFTLTLSPPCVPAAEGEPCEDCGCESGYVCAADGEDAAICQLPEPGDTCDDPFVIEAPEPFDEAIELEGSTIGATNGSNVSSASCPGLGFSSGSGARDQIFAFTADVTGVYTASVDAGSDLMIYAVTECEAPNDSCLAGQDTGNPETIDVALDAGATVYIVVDAWGSSTTADFTLSLSPPCIPAGDGEDCEACGCQSGLVCVAGDERSTCAPPAVGDTCDDPRTLDGDAESGFTGTGSIAPDTALTPQYDAASCPTGGTSGSSSPDEVWSFDPPYEGEWRVTATPSDGDVQLYAFADADATDGDDGCGTECIVRADSSASGGAETISVDATDVDRFYLVVDAFSSSGTEGTYDLQVCDATCPAEGCGEVNGCGDVCGCPPGEACDEGVCEGAPGNSCDDPFTDLDVSGGSATATGDTDPDAEGAGDVYDGESCTESAFGGGGQADQVWHVQGVYPGDWLITVSPSASPVQDLVLYVYVGGAEACGTAGDQCDYVDDTITTAESASVAVGEGDELFVVVDGYGTGDEGAYEITVEEVE